MSVRSIIGNAIGFVRGQPTLIAIWTMLYAIVALIFMFLMRPFAMAMVAFQQQVAADAAAGIRAPPPFPMGIMGTLFLVELAGACLSVIAFAAVVRAVARPAGDRFAYLRLGMDELRLVGLGILLLIAGLAIEMVAVLAIVLVGAVSGAAFGKPAGVTIAAILAIGLIGGAIYLEVRISLAGALTVLRQRIVIGPAWRATSGRFWTLFGVYALLALAFFGVSVLALVLTNPHLLAAYSSFDQRAVNAAAQEQLARQAAGISIGLLIQMIVYAIVFVVLGVTAIASVATAAIAWGGANPEEG